MDNHPIPQDITGFQFKLIGDMTIKQFAYLAGGSIIGWAIFSLPITSFVRLPFSFFFVLLGVAFAFFSVEGRPLDLMIINFLKAVFSPTQFVYQKGAVLEIRLHQISGPAMQASTPQGPKHKLDEKEENFLSGLLNLFSPPQAIKPESQISHPKIISQTFYQEPKKEIPGKETKEKEIEIQEEAQVEELKQEETRLKLQLAKAKDEEKDLGTSPAVQQKVLEIQKLLNDTLAEKQELENELMSLKRQIEEQSKQVFTVSEMPEKKESQNVRSVPPSQGIAVGLPETMEYPNLISGIIKDPRGNPLQNILVEVKDKDGNPVRAFKTNPLGQFSASTPLSNGIYRIEFEDPQEKNKFEVIEFEAKGDVILPIEVTSIDTREELRKELFKNQ